MQTIKTLAYGASGSLVMGKTLEEMEIERALPENDEVLIDILYCGVCHSDIHQVNDDWKNTIYPCVPGHEVVGRVSSVGSSVTKFSEGDIVGVGCMIDSCKECAACEEGEEQFCSGEHGPTMTYNGYWKPDESKFNTYGGFSGRIVVKESFVLNIPDGLEISSAAPILCAGVTTYSPLKHADIKPGDKVGIIGIGGLGHMAVKIAKAMGAEVTAITRKEEKRAPALELGADLVLISEDKDDMDRFESYFDFILCTIPYQFNVNPFICLLKRRSTLITVGLLWLYEKPANNMELVKLARKIGGSLIGGIAETQEVLEFCAANNIAPDIQLINIQDINEAFEKVKDEEVRFRYVIDMQSLGKAS